MCSFVKPSFHEEEIAMNKLVALLFPSTVAVLYFQHYSTSYLLQFIFISFWDEKNDFCGDKQLDRALITLTHCTKTSKLLCIQRLMKTKETEGKVNYYIHSIFYFTPQGSKIIYQLNNSDSKPTPFCFEN